MIVSNSPDLISIWLKKSAAADQAIATLGAEQRETRITSTFTGFQSII